MGEWDKLDEKRRPDPGKLRAYVDSPLWDDLCFWMEEHYEAKVVYEYNLANLEGWYVKYRRGGRSLCTLHPDEGCFTALVVVGERERARIELALPLLTPYLQKVYENTSTRMGQRWLKVRVDSRAVLEDLKFLIALKRWIH